MKNAIRILIILCCVPLLVQCGSTLQPASRFGSPMPSQGEGDGTGEAPSKLPTAQASTVRALNEYCKACHALGEMRFIYGENSDDIWNYIFHNKAPKSQKLWAEAIYEVLSWPNDVPPPFDDLLEAPNRDWMPKGAKRLHMANDVENGLPVRETILKTIEDHMKSQGGRP